MVFSLLGKGGYRYAESEAIRPIREQIMKPDKELVPFPLWDLSPLPKSKTLMASDNFIIMKRIGHVIVYRSGLTKGTGCCREHEGLT